MATKLTGSFLNSRVELLCKFEPFAPVTFRAINSQVSDRPAKEAKTVQPFPHKKVNKLLQPKLQSEWNQTKAELNL